ncbi:MAG: PRC-barrel domain-containing protein [Thalassobaculaceae bacterium]|nr:PRC-barrel domain-containing protein [Thalassobaculaceae bacterium]
MRANFMTTILCAAVMAGASQIVAVAQTTARAEDEVTAPPRTDAPAVEVRPMQKPTVDAATSVRNQRLVGAKVISVDEKEAGEVRRIIEDGGTRKAVIEVGGIFGIGEMRVAIPLADFTLMPDGKARVSLTQAEIKDLPEFKG